MLTIHFFTLNSKWFHIFVEGPESWTVDMPFTGKCFGTYEALVAICLIVTKAEKQLSTDIGH